LRRGLKVAEVPSFEAPRVYGTSRLRTIPDGWRVLKTICSEWRDSWRGEAVEAPELRRHLSMPESPLVAARARLAEATAKEQKVVVA